MLKRRCQFIRSFQPAQCRSSLCFHPRNFLSLGLLVLLLIIVVKFDTQNKNLIFSSTNITYYPSHFEYTWRNIVNDVNPVDCLQWEQDGVLGALLLEMANSSSYRDPSKIFDGNKRSSREIEPLVSFLRHPLSLFPGHRDRKTIMNKDYYMLPSIEEISQVRKKGGRLLFFDVGASLYDKGPGGDNGASLRWFVEKFNSYQDLNHKNVPFDRIFAWEATPYKPEILWGSFPSQIVNVLQYFNVPADANPLGKMNPLRLLQEVANVDDFVIFKLDVDHQTTELALIKQILSSTRVSSLIDELFWEHHVAGSAMCCPALWKGKLGSGWSSMKFKVQPGHGETLAESFELFTELRKRGIAAHSWV